MATQPALQVLQETASPEPWAPHVQLIDASQAASSGFITAWDDLAQHAAEPNPFSESWYLLPALRQFDRNGAVKLFLLWDRAPVSSTLLGLIPLSSEPRYGRWPIPNVQNWLHPNAFLGSPLVRRGSEDTFWRTLLSHLDGQPSGGLFFHLNGLVTGGPLQLSLDRVCRDQFRSTALVHQTQRAFLEGDQSPESYYQAAMRTKKRKELRRQKNRLDEMGVVNFARSNGAQGIAQWVTEFLDLERRGWKGANGSALDCADDTRTLFQQALTGAVARGKLELLDLRLDGKPLAMLVNFMCDPGAFSFKTAFDEDYARFSPGVLLQIENLALLERAGTGWCDSCAAQDHPMIDSLWTGRRGIGRYSMAIGGGGRRMLFGALLRAELARGRKQETTLCQTGDEGNNQ